MSTNPFGDISESPLERRERERAFSRRKWMAFWKTVLAIVLISLGAGLGGGCGSLFQGQGASGFVQHFLTGLIAGVVGGILAFLGLIYLLFRISLWSQSTTLDVLLPYSAMAGAFVSGVAGGGAGRGNSSASLICALVGAVLGLLISVALRFLLNDPRRFLPAWIFADEDILEPPT